jgi:hypothetical protein
MTSTSGPTKYAFFVDGKPYETTQQFITGEEIRKIAAVPSRLRLFLGERQNTDSVDRQVMRDDRVDLASPGEEKFYTLEPPTMDIY